MGERIKKWFKKNKVKLIVWGVIIIAAAGGFVHQYIIHTDEHIKGFIEKNKAEFSQAAEVLLEKPTTGAEFIGGLQGYDTAVKADNKFPIETLIDNPCYQSDTDILKAVDKLGTQDVKSDGTTVRFYQSSRFVVIYSPEKSEITGAESAGDGWFYIKSF